MALVGTSCTDDTQCKSQACFIYESDQNEKRCANTQMSCGSTNMPVYVNPTTVSCKFIGGKSCSSLSDTKCAYKCIQQKDSNNFRCSNKLPSCSVQSNTVTRVDVNGNLYCEPNNGELCFQNTDCYSNQCYAVSQSTDFRCSATTINCGTGSSITIVQNTLECKKNAGELCSVLGIDLNCFSGICAQNQGDPTVFKCITLSSVQTCNSCDNTKKCVVNTYNDGVCLLRNGQTIPDGTDCKQSCANWCIVSKLNIQTCSNKCDTSCDQTKCRSDPTGFLPTCFALAGEECVPQNHICDFDCLQTLDANNLQTNIFVCSKTKSSCKVIEVAVIKTDENIECQPNYGSICFDNSGCFSNVCYPVVQSVDFKCSQNAIDCKTSLEPKISALDLQLNPICIKVVGEPCSNDSDCFTNACYTTNMGEKKCAVKLICSTNQTPIFQNTTTSKCLKSGGQSCSLPDDSTCAFGCFSYRPDNSTKCAVAYEPACDNTHIGIIKQTDNIKKCYLIPDQDCEKSAENCQFECMQDLGANYNFKCSNSIQTCTSPQTPFISATTKIVVCKLENYQLCQSDAECASNTCYPVIQSLIKKCAPNQIDCTSYPGMIPAININLNPVCIKNTGQICSTEGVDASCFSGICAQIRNMPHILKCIPTESISTCQSCDSSKKCVNDQSVAICLMKNGQINCDTNSCANSCIISKNIQMICSVQCETTCDPSKCKSDQTGENPSCKSKLSGGAIAGIVIGLWLLFSLSIITLCFIKRRNLKQKEKSSVCRDNQVQGVLRIELAGLHE
ncbi:Hypothetical_protein [Hexamita inflata]|uniref:Hypothetical_protein n=1 Tax=Hexamita inflata TaxID=28002 RepID=A0AA86QST3_9EUKA|nr:Hypothetical protein HINF_LOCUS46523 [Hexamita inflata]